VTGYQPNPRVVQVTRGFAPKIAKRGLEPSPVPAGFSVLGHYKQPNNRPHPRRTRRFRHRNKVGQQAPTPVATDRSNLPQGGDNDYSMDLPADGDQKERAVKRGDHAGARAYVQAKPMLGGTATDLVLWLFYPFNGPARAKVGPLTVRLGCIGEHVTLRVSNFSGALARPGLLLPAQRG
jgi:hypothetical protein